MPHTALLSAKSEIRSASCRLCGPKKLIAAESNKAKTAVIEGAVMMLRLQLYVDRYQVP